MPVIQLVDGEEPVKRVKTDGESPTPRAKRRTTYYAQEPSKEEGKNPKAVGFATRLNRQLLSRGWRQADLAREIEKHLKDGRPCNRAVVSSWFQGRFMPSPLFMDALCKALNVDLNDLVGGTAHVVGRDENEFKLNVDGSGFADIVLNMRLPEEIALKIAAIAREYR